MSGEDEDKSLVACFLTRCVYTNRTRVHGVDVFVDVKVDDGRHVNAASASSSVRLSRVDTNAGIHLNRLQRLATICQLPPLNTSTTDTTVRRQKLVSM